MSNAPPPGISLSGSTSSSLIERVKAGDPAGWSTLTEIYGPLVYRWGRRAGLQASDAADIVQEVFRSVAAHIADFRHEKPADSFQGWLWVVTRNKVRDHFRRLALEPQAKGGSEAQSRLLAVADDSPADDSSPDDSPSFQVTHRILEAVRGEFEPKTWQAFWLTAVDERPAADVGQELGMTVGAVYVAKSRVMARIRLEAAGLFDE